MINLGRYPATDAPNVRFIPQPIDRILEGVTTLLIILMWIGFFIFRNEQTPITTPIIATVITALMLGCAYAPIRYFNLPVRITEQNAAVQYLLACRLCRAISIPVALLLWGRLFSSIFEWSIFITLASVILLFGAMITYYVLAFRHK